MKALFITTKTVDCANHVRAWNSFAPIPAAHVTLNPQGVRNDWQAVEAAQEIRPAVIFYIGACSGPGNPRYDALRSIRAVAPTVNIVSDAADRPWHGPLENYRRQNCFDLQVAIDGAHHAPVDLATLTPVDPAPFRDQGAPRDIRCGFSGTVGRWNTRSEIVNALEWFGGLTVRRREAADGYASHAKFLRRSRILLNTSWTGTGLAHHIKGRVIEAGWAGCALLESHKSPIGEWFAPGCYLTWKDARDAADVIANVSDEEIDLAAQALSLCVREQYSPARIYGGMLERLGLHVDSSEPRSAA